jgi:hypothetical protein
MPNRFHVLTLDNDSGGDNDAIHRALDNDNKTLGENDKKEPHTPNPPFPSPTTLSRPLTCP